jgi:hypothetical protein
MGRTGASSSITAGCVSIGSALVQLGGYITADADLCSDRKPANNLGPGVALGVGFLHAPAERTIFSCRPDLAVSRGFAIVRDDVADRYPHHLVLRWSERVRTGRDGAHGEP